MEFKNFFVNCKIVPFNNYANISITGNILNRENYKSVLLIACNPVNKNNSYSGTGLPFPCADIAFDGTKNIYNIDLSGEINTVFSYPNSYYSIGDKKKLVSSLFFILEYINEEKEFIRIELNDLYPLRTLVNRENRRGPEFYSTKYELLPIDDQYIIMQEYAKLKITEKIA